MHFRRLYHRIIAALTLAALPIAAHAQSTPLHTSVEGTVLTYQLGWNHAWITSCPQSIKIGAGVLGGVRNVATSTSAVSWNLADELNANGNGPVLDFEASGLAGGQIVTLVFPGIAFANGLVFTCSGALPSAPTGAPGPIEVFFR